MKPSLPDYAPHSRYKAYKKLVMHVFPAIEASPSMKCQIRVPVESEATGRASSATPAVKLLEGHFRLYWTRLGNAMPL